MRKYNQDEQDMAVRGAANGSAADAPPKRSLGLYRTLLAVAACVATVVLVVWIGWTSGSYVDDKIGAHKAIVIVVEGLHPEMLDFATKSHKAPFITELVSHGAVYGSLAVPSTVADQLAAHQAILTGLTPLQSGVYSSNDFNKYANATSFLRLARNAELKTSLIAPEGLFSGSSFENGRCRPLGVLDAECVGLACPSDDAASYCNANWRFKTSESLTSAASSTLRNEDYILSKIEASTSARMDVVYVELSNFAAAGGASKDLSTNSLAAISEMYVTDALVGRIASHLAARSAAKRENWLLFLTSEANNAYRKAPFLIANFNDGAPKAVTQPAAAASILDVYPTIVQWMGLSPYGAAKYNGTILGICAKNGRTLVQGC